MAVGAVMSGLRLQRRPLLMLLLLLSVKIAKPLRHRATLISRVGLCVLACTFTCGSGKMREYDGSFVVRQDLYRRNLCKYSLAAQCGSSVCTERRGKTGGR